MKRIAIFASGSGSNAENIVHYFQNNSQVKVSLILSNQKNACVLERAKILNVPTIVFTRKDFYDSDYVVNVLKENKVDLIVLAGFMWLIPDVLIKNFPDAIVNIHPALLPKYGGKGMYGIHVHEAVIESGDRESGISIHMVNENYDEGEVIFQAHCPVKTGDTPQQLADRIHDLEYKHYPKVIEKLVLK